MSPTRIGSCVTILVILITACGADTERTSPTSIPRVPATETETLDDGGGWIAGEPDWNASATASTDAASAAASAPAGSATVEVAAPVADIEPAATLGLNAGSVDDNADYAGYLEYAARLAALGIESRPFDPSRRIVVTVTGSNGLPAVGVPVIVSTADEPVATLRTTANGTARFLPGLYGAATEPTFTLTVGDIATSAAPGDSVTMTLASLGGVASPVALDILFLLDATGSMGDEIDQLKSTVDQVAADVAALPGSPDVRFAFTLYRDEGDAFVTSSFDFTSDVETFREALVPVVADGGGDYPEALEEGLAEALGSPAWRDPAATVQLVFLVADAPPRLDRQVQVDYPASIREAVARGIKIFPIASSESDDQAEMVFRQIALGTGARFVFLSYGAAGAATGASTDIDVTDYEVMSLDALVVRFVAEELAAATGTEVPIPPPVEPPPTTPPGQ